MVGKYQLSTLGCKVNQYESQQIRELLESLDFEPVRANGRADLAVVNTCAVTAAAMRKSRQAIRRLARGGRTAIVVVGCGATAEAETFRRLDGVIATLGHDADVAAELSAIVAQQADRIGIPKANNGVSTTHPRQACPEEKRYEPSMKPVAEGYYDPTEARRPVTPQPSIPCPLPIVKTNGTRIGRIEQFAGHQRAFLKVQDGCDAFCTYCIIPQLRPTLRCKPIGAVVAEARDLVKAGHKEIIITGIFLGAYGRETAVRKRFSSGPSPLADLVAALARVPGLARLRLSSLEPGDVDEHLLEVIAMHDNCVPHLHLPLQSGSPSILRRMNRQYTRDAFLGMIQRVRDALEQPAITTDIIVGFPGETDEDFEATLDVARFAEFCKIHAFPFSPRQKTAAARWQAEFVEPPVARERMGRLAEVEQQGSLAYRRRRLGEVERVLVESGRGPNGNASDGMPDFSHGRTDRYFPVDFEAEGVRPGDLVSVRIDRITPTRTHGTYLPTGTTRLPLSVLAELPA